MLEASTKGILFNNGVVVAGSKWLDRIPTEPEPKRSSLREDEEEVENGGAGIPVNSCTMALKFTGSVVRTVVGAFLDALVRFLGFGFGSIAIDDELGNGTWLELDEGSNKVGGFKNAGTESRNEPNSLSPPPPPPPPLEDCILLLLLLFYQNLRGEKERELLTI
ncbi:hypothetical protein GQ457_07G020600 [Hibiscus cannabinus]